MPRALHIINTVLSLGLNLVVKRLGIDPRWRYLMWGAIALNELRGLAVVWQFGGAALRAAS